MESEKFEYGRLSAGVEANVAKLTEHSMGNLLSNSRGEGTSKAQDLFNSSDEEFYDARSRGSSIEQLPDPSSPTNSVCYLLSLPAELIDHICAYLGPLDFDRLGHTCKNLRKHAFNDLLWHQHVQDNTPGVEITHSRPCKTYRELYFAHDPHWFLSRNKIWVSDISFTGMVIISRYDPDRGCIEAFRIVAEREHPEYETWEHDGEVLIHSFEPKVKLHLDMPVLQLDVHTLEKAMIDHPTSQNRGRAHRETPMAALSRSGTFSNFFLAREIKKRRGVQVWPPETIPSSHHVRNHSQCGFRGSGHKPQQRHEVSEHAFRLRRWARLNGFLVGDLDGEYVSASESQSNVQTFATLDEKLYTPTAEYPWRGIFVGDYSGHGCEFLLMNQPDHEPYDEHEYERRCGETQEDYEARIGDPKIHRGSIEAIKLTGDPNVPRGEYTFVADDIGPNSYVRTADEARFKGARIVKSRGHIAERYFRADKYIESQLIMISPNRLAQYWLGFGHISFYERVDINQFLNPRDDPHRKAETSGSRST